MAIASKTCYEKRKCLGERGSMLEERGLMLEWNIHLPEKISYIVKEAWLYVSGAQYFTDERGSMQRSPVICHNDFSSHYVLNFAVTHISPTMLS